jgi:hypothetical protein
MTAIQYCQLPAAGKPLLNKFYRAHRSSMRASGGSVLWAVKHIDIIAGLSLTRVGDGHWLTGLFVSPDWRNQGIAAELLRSAMQGLDGPVWLFCHPQLEAFYARSGFTPAAKLPPPLAEKLTRYSRFEPLLAMVCMPVAGALTATRLEGLRDSWDRL